LCTFVSFVVNGPQMLEPRRPPRYTKGVKDIKNQNSVAQGRTGYCTFCSSSFITSGMLTDASSLNKTFLRGEPNV
jgi:hypothetical protein